MPDASQELRQTTDGVDDISDSRKSIEAAVNDPVAFVVVLAITAANAILLSALDYFQAKLDTPTWLGVIVGLVLVLTGIGFFFLREKRRTYPTRMFRRNFVIVGLLSAGVIAVFWWWISAGSKATIESVAGITSPGRDCFDGPPQLEFDNPPQAFYCLPVLHTEDGGDRLVEGAVGGRVSGDLWLEVHTPAQSWSPRLPNQAEPALPERSIQSEPQWFYSPVIEKKSGAWQAYATIGTQLDSTPKWHKVRLISCPPDATERILAKSYRVPSSDGQVALDDRHAYPWGNRCEKELDAVAVLFQPDPKRLEEEITKQS